MLRAGSSTRPQLEIVVRTHDEDYGHTWNSGWMDFLLFGNPLVNTTKILSGIVVHLNSCPSEKELNLDRDEDFDTILIQAGLHLHKPQGEPSSFLYEVADGRLA